MINTTKKITFSKKNVSILTTLLSLATISAGSALADRVYYDPTIDGRRVDVCINSYMYPEECSRGAIRRVAQEYCEAAGHDHVRSYQYRTSKNQIGVSRFLEERDNTYWYQTRGGWLFTVIHCGD